MSVACDLIALFVCSTLQLYFAVHRLFFIVPFFLMLSEMFIGAYRFFTLLTLAHRF